MWSTPTEDLNLHKGDIHLWKAGLNIDSAYQELLWNQLNKAEQDRANRFRFDKDRMHFIAGRGILRQLLAQYLNTLPTDIQFEYSAYGKPSLKANPSLKFNLSHSNGLGLFAFTSDYELGVDIEFFKPDVDFYTLARNFFSQNEAQALLKLPPAHLKEGFYNCWTRKEAIIKAIGKGLSFPLDQFEVSLHPGNPAELIATYWDVEEVQYWTLSSFEPQTQFKGALAYRGQGLTVHYYRFDELF